MRLYTIGHSAHAIQKFIKLLQLQQIQLVADVRSAPVSRWHPQYNKKALQAVLNENQIGYVFLGEQLGGRPKDRTCYPPGTAFEKGKPHPKASFSTMMERPWFLAGIDDLLERASRVRTALLCSEADPLHCHRHGLIARHLQVAHPEIEVLHIYKDGTLGYAQTLL